MPALEVPLTELKAKLSEYTRLVGQGQTFNVTSNGRVVAVLSSPTPVGGYGNGTWMLVDDNVDGAQLQFPLPPVDRPVDPLPAGYEQLLRAWEPEHRDNGILWRHLTDGAVVIAVPTARWTRKGRFEFFHVDRDGTRITPLKAWSSGLGTWENDHGAFDAAHREAMIRGSQSLGIT